MMMMMMIIIMIMNALNTPSVQMGEDDLEDLLKRLLDKTETGLSWPNS